MFYFLTTLLLIISGMFSATKTKSDVDLKTFYFPVESMKEVQIYDYVTDEESPTHMYWVLERRNKSGVTYLETDVYVLDASGELNRTEFVEEEIALYGAFLRGFTAYDKTPDGEDVNAESKIGSNTILTWKMDVGGKTEWNLEYEDPVYTGYTKKIRKIRTLEKDKHKISYNNEKLPAVIFEDRIEISFGNVELGDWKISKFRQHSTYAYGLGLYQFVRYYEEGNTTYTLSDILSFEEWNAIKD